MLSPNHRMYGCKAIEVMRIQLQTMNGMGNVYHRPFVMDHENFDDAMIVLTDCIEQAPAITPSVISESAGMFIKPAMTPHKPIDIPNGCGTPRYRFIAFIRIHKHSGPPTILLISGYTDYSDHSYSGMIDPEITFFINSINELYDTSNSTNNAAFTKFNGIESSHVIFSLGDNASVLDSTRETLQRPQDVITFLSDNEEYAEMGFGQNTTKFVGTIPLKTKVRHNSPARFLGDLAASTRASARMNSLYGSTQEIAANVFSDEKIANPGVTRDAFLSAISKVRGTGTVSGYFTLSELEEICPNARDLIVSSKLSAESSVGYDTIDWASEDIVTQFTTVLSLGISTYMHDVGIGYMHFSCIMGENPVIVDARTVVPNYDYSQYLSNWVYCVKNELIKSAMQCLEHGRWFRIEMIVDLYGFTHTKIEIDGMDGIFEYTWPSFCDNRLSPIVNDNHEQVQDLYSSTGLILNQIT